MKKLMLLSLIVSLVCSAEVLKSELLMKKIKSSDPAELINIIKQGKSESDELDSYSLIFLSMASLKNKDRLDAELFLYQANLRANFDKEIYTPIETGGNSPLLAFMALSQQLAVAINNSKTKTPEQYQFMIDSLKNWNPICNSQYNPGWDYKVAPDLKSCQSKFHEMINETLASMIHNKVLYEHPSYFKLLKQWRNLQMKLMFSQSTEPDEELIKIQNKLISIENELGVKGEVTKFHLESSVDSNASLIIGTWKLYKDDDYPNKEKYNEIINFRSDGRFCDEATTIFGGKYDLKPKSLTVFVSLFGNSSVQKREYKLKNNELKLKNRKIGWAYYKKLNDTPNENCYVSLKLSKNN